jgi:hypothetical protein
VVKYAHLKDPDPIDMKGIAGFPDTVGAIGTLYEKLIANWEQYRPDIPWDLALVGDGPLADLWPAAECIYYGTDHDVVIFGHTHKCSLEPLLLLAAAPQAQVTRFRLPLPAIYANSGAWIDSAPCCTYVETEEDASAGRHYVRVLNYPAKKVLGQGFVKL